MITIISTNVDELKSFWNKIEGEYELVEKIHLDQDKLDYKMTVANTSKGLISPVLKSIAEKVFEADQMIHDVSFFEDFTYKNFLRKVEGEMAGERKFPGVARLTFIWPELKQMEKRMLYDYLSELLVLSNNYPNSKVS